MKYVWIAGLVLGYAFMHNLSVERDRQWRMDNPAPRYYHGGSDMTEYEKLQEQVAIQENWSN